MAYVAWLGPLGNLRFFVKSYPLWSKFGVYWGTPARGFGILLIKVRTGLGSLLFYHLWELEGRKEKSFSNMGNGRKEGKKSFFGNGHKFL